MTHILKCSIPFLLPLFLLFSLPILGTEEEEMDKALRQELGQETKDKKKSEKKDSSPSEKKTNNEADDLIRQRYANSSEDSSSTLLWILVKVSIVLGILVGAFYYILKFLSKNRDARFPVRGEMRVLSSLVLSPGKELQLVEISGMVVVLGISENSVSLVKEIDDPSVKERLFSKRDAYEPPTETFVDYFLKSIQGVEKKPKSFTKSNVDFDDNDEQLLEELQVRQMERLDKLRQDRDHLTRKEKSPKKPDF